MPLATYLAKPGNIKLITSLGDYTLPIPALVLSPEAMYALGWEGIYGRLVHNIPKNSPIKSYTNKFIILEHQETIDPNNNEDMQLMIHIYKHELQHYLHDYYDLESKVDLFYNELVAKVSDIAPSDGNGRARIIITLIGGDYGMLDNERHEKKDTLS